MKRNHSLLIIDDDPRLRRLLQLNLEAEGYTVYCSASGREGFEVILTRNPDGLILDLMLPDMDGLELCERVREFSDIPILILTARKGEADLEQSLDTGADDYIAKPFSRVELLARVRAMLRRAASSPCQDESQDLTVGDLMLKCAERRLIHAGESIKLSHTEFKLLYFLMANPNRLITQDELVAKVWGWEGTDGADNLRTYIRYLRQKIEPDPSNPSRIVTERGIGYIFVAP